MEDAHTTVLSMPEDPSCAFFAVYDGHCGEKIARYCGEKLHGRVAASQHFKKGEWEEAMNEGFLGTDMDLLSSDLRHDPSGCTAVSCLVTTKGEIICANAGDSRAVLSRGGRAVPLSFDHKPTNDAEMKRIQLAGGYVTAGRVNGNLALSRAIGDFTFKQNTQLRAEEQMVCAQPEIIRESMNPEDEFIVLACDGIWDVMSNEQVVAHVREELQHSQDLAAICEKTFEKCLAPRYVLFLYRINQRGEPNKTTTTARLV